MFKAYEINNFNNGTLLYLNQTTHPLYQSLFHIQMQFLDIYQEEDRLLSYTTKHRYPFWLLLLPNEIKSIKLHEEILYSRSLGYRISNCVLVDKREKVEYRN